MAEFVVEEVVVVVVVVVLPLRMCGKGKHDFEWANASAYWCKFQKMLKLVYMVAYCESILSDVTVNLSFMKVHKVTSCVQFKGHCYPFNMEIWININMKCYFAKETHLTIMGLMHCRNITLKE